MDNIGINNAILTINNLGDRVSYYFDFVTAAVKVEYCYLVDDLDDKGDDKFSLEEIDNRELSKVFARCKLWNDEYNGEDDIGYSWSLDIDGRIIKGTNAFPQDWEEFIDALNYCTVELSIVNLFDFLDYRFDDNYCADNILSLMEDEHPQTYYRGASLFKKGNVVKVEKINEVKTIATVIGSRGDKYKVELFRWEDSGLDTFRCSCPSNQIICKHIVAAVMAEQKQSLITRYHEAVKNGTVVGKYEISEAELERLALLVGKSIITLKMSDFEGISACMQVIESVEATLDDRCKAVMQGLDWNGMVTVPWFPRIKKQELYWGLQAIISQVEYPTVETQAQRNYEKVLKGELLK